MKFQWIVEENIDGGKKERKKREKHKENKQINEEKPK